MESVDAWIYYYGARYYNPRESVWLSTDPLSGYNPVMEVEHYIDGEHNGGVYNSFNHNTYGYCYQNPVLLVDPNGKQNVTSVAITIAKEGTKGLIKYGKSFNPVSLFSSVVHGIFVTPTHVSTVGYVKVADDTKGWTVDQVKTLSKERSNKNDERQGSYTISFANGKKYHGKGKIDRMFESATVQSTTHSTNVTSLDWKPAKENTDREAFKDEYIRMQGDRTDTYTQGYLNPDNYNQRNSPGREYMKQDNDPRLKAVDPDNNN